MIIAGVYFYPIILQTKAWTLNQDQLIPTNFSFIIYFNQPMIQETVNANLIIKPAIPYSTVWSDDLKQLTLFPQEPLKPNTVYQVYLKQGRSYSGTLIKSKKFTFRTEADLRSVAYLPQAQQTEKKIDMPRRRRPEC